MRHLHNIEKGEFGMYIGHTEAGTWQICKTNSTYGNWIARLQLRKFIDAVEPTPVYGHTLAQLSDRLFELDCEEE